MTPAGTARYVPHQDVFALDATGHFIVDFLDIFRKVDTMSKMGSRTAGGRARRQFSDEFRIGAGQNQAGV